METNTHFAEWLTSKNLNIKDLTLKILEEGKSLLEIYPSPEQTIKDWIVHTKYGKCTKQFQKVLRQVFPGDDLTSLFKKIREISQKKYFKRDYLYGPIDSSIVMTVEEIEQVATILKSIRNEKDSPIRLPVFLKTLEFLRKI